MEKFISVYSTFGSADKAKEVARVLVDEMLVACANILPGAVSIYKWKGATEEGHEAVMFAKTRQSLFPQVKARILELHDYEVPCIVGLEISGGDEKFLRWIEKETLGNN
jgi:periplasmic divalent cation tolerance protein